MKGKKAALWQKRGQHPNDMPVVTEVDKKRMATIDRYEGKVEAYGIRCTTIKVNGRWIQVFCD